jgi:hypothetical protein
VLVPAYKDYDDSRKAERRKPPGESAIGIDVTGQLALFRLNSQ